MASGGRIPWSNVHADPGERSRAFNKLCTKLINMVPHERLRFFSQEEDFIYSNQGWNPARESRTKAAKRIKATFEEHLERHLDFKELTAREQGLLPVPRKLGRKLQKERLRFTWIIRSHVHRWSKSRIAKEYLTKTKAVRESIKIEAALIGLILSQ
jgi:hypothetical protein